MNPAARQAGLSQPIPSHGVSQMTTQTATERERVDALGANEGDRQASFAETALKLAGKSQDEARRMGAVDKADEQVEALFRVRTESSPVHRAVWDATVPLDLFQPPPLPESAPCDKAMEASLAVVRKHRDASSNYDKNGKITDALLEDLGKAGYWGMLIEPKYGGQGAPFTRFAPFLTRIALIEPMAAGLASVHGCIGAVDPLRGFGTEEQKQRFLPKLASGEALSAFALTEPCAGSDLTALRTTAVRVGDELEITGEKLFITNAVEGRTIGLVCMYEGRPAVVIVELPKQQNEQFQIVPYGLYAVKHAYNQGLKFNKLRVPISNLLKPKVGDGLTIAYHGLNLGRISLCAASAATMRVMLANLLPWAQFRKTYGDFISTRELVKRRIARLAGLITGADALVAWTSWLLDEGYRGEMECIVAKIFGSESQKEAAIELVMKTHGGRSFLHGHMWGDNLHDFLAPCIYEGEGEVLGLAFFKSLVKEHGKRFFEPIGKALQAHGMKTFNPANPLHAWRLRKEMAAYGKWVMAQKFTRRDRQQIAGMKPQLSQHLDFALDQFSKFPSEISSAMRKHQLKLADRQCRMAELSQRVQDTVVMLVTTLWANRQKSDVTVAAADLLCQDIRRKLTGERPSDAYFKQASQLAEEVLAGGFEQIAGVPRQEILMKYETK
jgi:alkylation response protein AidB-like acyl-CoA dehydrogenase